MAGDWSDKIRDTVRSGIAGLREFAYAPVRRDGHARSTPGHRSRIGLALGGGFARGRKDGPIILESVAGDAGVGVHGAQDKGDISLELGIAQTCISVL